MFTKSIKKIALIGPESTGKTTLCINLSEYFKTVWVPEFSRSYITSLNRKYNLDDVVHCANGQIKEESRRSLKANRFLFCDTETITAQVWCEDVFGTIPKLIEDMSRIHQYDLYLLTYPDLPFEKDAVRENGHRREFFFEWYKKEISKKNRPFEIIKGTGVDRLRQAIRALENTFRM